MKCSLIENKIEGLKSENFRNWKYHSKQRCCTLPFWKKRNFNLTDEEYRDLVIQPKTLFPMEMFFPIGFSRRFEQKIQRRWFNVYRAFTKHQSFSLLFFFDYDYKLSMGFKSRKSDWLFKIIKLLFIQFSRNFPQNLATLKRFKNRLDETQKRSKKTNTPCW